MSSLWSILVRAWRSFWCWNSLPFMRVKVTQTKQTKDWERMELRAGLPGVTSPAQAGRRLLSRPRSGPESRS